MRYRLIVISLVLIFIALTGCNSKQSEELAEYYNSYVETVNPLGEKINEQSEKLTMIEDDQEALEYHTKEIIPLVQKIEEFIESIEPESEIVQELHDLRSKQFNAWIQGFSLRTQAFEEAANEGGEVKINKLVQQSDQKFVEAQQHAIEADQRFLQMANEYNVKIVESEND